MTKDADKMLCCLYKEYLERVKVGSSKRDARKFTSEYFSENLPFADWHPDDVSMVRSELSRNKYLKANIIGGVEFTEDGISYMENRFKNNLKELTDFISKLPSIPGYTS